MSTTQKAETAKNQVPPKLGAIGATVKKHVGRLVGDVKMEAEATVAEAKAEAREEEIHTEASTARTGERVKGVVEEVIGAVEGRVGKLLDNDRMQSEGLEKELRGQARQKENL